MRLGRLWVAVLLWAAGCGSNDLLADATAPVGVPCSAPPTGEVIGRAGEHARFHFGARGEIVLRTGGDVMRIGGSSGCSIAGTGGRGITVEDGTLGSHDVGPSAGSAARVAVVGSGEYASSGTVEITGYDPSTGSLCGDYIIELESGTETGSFDAAIICD